MSQRVLEKLFDSPSKLRLLKLFLRNPDEKFPLSEIRKRTMLSTPAIKRELVKLGEIKMVKNLKKKGSSDRNYYLNHEFSFLKELQNLILKSSPADEKKMLGKIKGLGRVKVAILSGIFMKPDRENSRTDILLVCNDVNEKKLNNFMQNLEAEAGIELQYTVLTTDEFSYRYSMFDRFLLDVLEKPHKKLLNKLLR
ncbi:MAG: hypothetical protein A2919_01360 [Candidatus Spechtbacteria bacterium RIFCSPLOWO2_01_FULL_43_12]|uniref:HTH arsR-type domain-containing protein n=1 Tax=Candidatus Spechtbacteria bacterium RIFCSPLOWO2_01_FULL_43_12 TaxID=1802162 RepID=A0A1G2HEJ3_9BACT|nr:MAG: hypothetical protein A2919_01360 [Candidatus Spechtbacteria bacterium RIFCSPLOWO2_01_FULL_43_12]